MYIIQKHVQYLHENNNINNGDGNKEIICYLVNRDLNYGKREDFLIPY